MMRAEMSSLHKNMIWLTIYLALMPTAPANTTHKLIIPVAKGFSAVNPTPPTQIPPVPPLTKGGTERNYLGSPPLAKGDLGGFKTNLMSNIGYWIGRASVPASGQPAQAGKPVPPFAWF
jgi:hypothetical protein